MVEVPISEFKAKCLAMLEQVRKTRKPIRVTRHGRPVADILPPAPAFDRKAWIGSMKESMEICGEIISPANDLDDWEVLKD